MRPTAPVIASQATPGVAIHLPGLLRRLPCRLLAMTSSGRVLTFGLFLALSSLLLAPRSRAAEPADLGQGLTYLRIGSLEKSARDLRAALLHPTPLVLDLRYTADEPAAGDILRVLNSQPARPTLYVLVSPATPSAVAEIVTATPARRTTLGIKGSVPVPDVIIEQTAEADRAAYDAFEAGTTLAQLVSGRIEKERFDEASLVQEFKNGNHDAQPPALPAVTGASAAPTRPTDRVLQRAVHLHRALLALKRG